MEISTRTRGAVEIVDFVGRATIHTHQQLRETVRYAIHCGRHSVVLNLMHATTLDSLTIGELVACLKRTREHGGAVHVVVSAGGTVHELLQLTGLDRVLPIFGDVDEAAAVFRSRPAPDRRTASD